MMSSTADFIRPGIPALVLAPMEGVTDAPMRAILTERGGFKFCVSEFLRISQELLPPKTYLSHIPELESGCRTPAGVLVQVQLLGGDPEKLAQSALRACELGAPAIDLNFGCPAPTVNRHDGGASLLRYPDRIRSIVGAVRAAVPQSIPISAKLRLGWDCTDAIDRNAEAAVLGGASWITIHARTRMQGYAPPVHWTAIARVRRSVPVPVVANGDIWTFEDYLKCRDVTQCEHFMLGRGVLANPILPFQIAHELGLGTPPQLVQWGPLLRRFVELTQPYSTHSQYTVRRIKQWLKFAHARGWCPEFDTLKRAETLDEILLAFPV